MQIGILLSADKFREETVILGDLVDFIEVILSGKEDVSIFHGSRYKLLAHLDELDRMCFESLELAEDLGITKAVIHFFTRGQITFDEKIATLSGLYKKAVEYRVTLCLENTEESISVLKSVFERIPGLKFCLDVGHANLFSNNPVNFIGAFSDRLEHVHISDNRGGNSEEDDLHLPPGEGTIDFQRIFSELKAKNYDKTMTLELHPRFNVNTKVGSLRRLKTRIDPISAFLQA